MMLGITFKIILTRRTVHEVRQSKKLTHVIKNRSSMIVWFY